jgi:hypothetical protein
LTAYIVAGGPRVQVGGNRSPTLFRGEPSEWVKSESICHSSFDISHLSFGFPAKSAVQQAQGAQCKPNGK